MPDDPEDADVVDAPIVITGAAPGMAMIGDAGHFHASNMTFWLQPTMPGSARPGDCWIESDALANPAQPLANKKVHIFDSVDWIRIA